MKTFHNKVAVALLGVAFFAAGAHADETKSLTVHYSDLNLNTTAGAKVLYRRIYTAAKQVCGDVNFKQMETAAAEKRCLDQAVEKSVRSVNEAKVTHIANEHRYGVRTALSIVSAQ